MAGRKQTASMELAIGATIIAGIIMLIVMLMAWGNSTSFLSRHYRVVVNMVNVGGLKEGAPVKMGGFQIGRVASIQIRPGGTDMEIVLDIDEDRLLPEGSSAKVSTAGLVGDAFMEIIPGKSTETIRRAATVADAARLESAPLPDMSEILVKVNEFGDQLTILTANLNDVIGDVQFRKNLKSLANNIDAVSYQANLLLQRGQNVVDNVELATQNIAVLSNTLKDSVEQVTDNIEDVTARAREIADSAKSAINNIDGGITDARDAIRHTIGDPDVAANLASAIKNINTVTDTLAKHQESLAKALENSGELSRDLKEVTARVRDITNAIEVTAVSKTITQISTAMDGVTLALGSMTEIVDKIKAEPVLALSVNKAADRIVKMKFDEMSRQPQFRNTDAVLDEINRWVQDALRRGHFPDPAYPYDKRPYTMAP